MIAKKKLSQRPKQRPGKKRDMRKFAEKLWDDMRRISDPLERGLLGVDRIRIAKLTPEELTEFFGWWRASHGPVSSLNIGM